MKEEVTMQDFQFRFFQFTFKVEEHLHLMFNMPLFTSDRNRSADTLSFTLVKEHHSEYKRRLK